MTKRMSNKYKLRPAEQYICLDDLDFSWDYPLIDKVVELWNAGKDILYIAEAVERPAEEVFLLLLDQARLAKICGRPGGVWG